MSTAMRPFSKAYKVGRSHRIAWPQTERSVENRSELRLDIRRRNRRIISSLALICMCGGLSSCGTGGPRFTPHSALPPAAVRIARDGGADSARSSSASVPFRFFSPSSFWNRRLTADAPLDPGSAARMSAFIRELATEVRSGRAPWVNTVNSGIPVYTVSLRQPIVPVHLEDHSPDAALSSAWKSVPLPPDAEPTGGPDGSLVVWQPSTDRLWEFHQLVHKASGWYASWGGAMRHVSSNPGVFQRKAWPGAKPWWGISASSLSLVGGLISVEDVELGQINHALEMAVPQRSASIFIAPAQRTDGTSTSPLALPEGAHLRLNPNVNLAALHLPRFTLMLAKAAQRYGIFITDGTGVSGVTAFFAQDPVSTAAGFYIGSDGHIEGESPSRLLATFPWSQLQLLKMTPRRVGSARRR